MSDEVKLQIDADVRDFSGRQRDKQASLGPCVQDTIARTSSKAPAAIYSVSKVTPPRGLDISSLGKFMSIF